MSIAILFRSDDYVVRVLECLLTALTLLAGINILFIVDVELQQAGEDNVWGFGQVLVLLLFVIPLRDAGNAILDIQRGIQGRFEESFEHESKEPPVLDELKRLVDEGADPRQWRVADNYGDLLQIAAHYGKLELVEWPEGKRIVLEKQGCLFLVRFGRSTMLSISRWLWCGT